MSKGYVYILTNPSLREVSCGERAVKEKVPPVKIGMTKDVPHRMGTLNTSTPQNFVDELIVELSSEKDALVLENMVHEKLEDFRIVNDDGATEFFNCTVALAKETVKRLAKKLHFPLTEFKKMNYRGRSSSKIKANLKAMQAASVVKASEKNPTCVAAAKHLAAPFQFAMLAEAGVKIGSVLEFVYGGQKVKVADLKNKIEFEGGTYTTSGFCKKFMPDEKRNAKDAYQGPKYFTFKGELLTDLRAKLGK